MRRPALRPRPDQVLELTRELELPLPAIPDELMGIIAEKIEGAFRDLKATAAATIASGTEAEITSLLEARLNAMLDTDGLWAGLVLCVARGKETVSFDGTHLEKRPDLTIYLTDRQRNHPLLTEAKIIDKAAGKTINLYCENGVRRFLAGEYAWGTREGFMLAYVRDGSKSAATLPVFLNGAPPPGFSVVAAFAPSGVILGDGLRSDHDRHFAYPPPLGVPGPVALWHLWMS
jgi:hypothetical protein